MTFNSCSDSLLRRPATASHPITHRSDGLW